jgi:hypothetical protein
MAVDSRAVVKHQHHAAAVRAAYAIAAISNRELLLLLQMSASMRWGPCYSPTVRPAVHKHGSMTAKYLQWFLFFMSPVSSMSVALSCSHLMVPCRSYSCRSIGCSASRPHTSSSPIDCTDGATFPRDSGEVYLADGVSGDFG